MSTRGDAEVERLRQQERWQAAVRATMAAWGSPQDEAEELVKELYQGVTDQAALAVAKEDMPQAQAAIQNAAMQLADALALGLLAPDAVARLRRALAEYDAEATRQYKERSTRT